MVAAVARKAHNLEVGGSIPSLATKQKKFTKDLENQKSILIFVKQLRKRSLN